MVVRVSVLVFVFGFLLSWTQGSLKFGDVVSPCSLKDPELERCLVTQATALWPHLVAGAKEFGFVPMEPFFVPLMQVQEGNSDAVGLAFKITNSSHYGYKDMTIESAKVDPTTFHFEFNVHFPVYVMIGTYEIKGRILVLPIVGQGFINMTTVGTRVRYTLDFKKIQRKEKTYLQLMNFRNTYITVDKMHILLDNLFGNKQLSDSMNAILNENSQASFEELKPSIEDIYSELFLSLVGRMFSKISLNKLFKDTDL